MQVRFLRAAAICAALALPAVAANAAATPQPWPQMLGGPAHGAYRPGSSLTGSTGAKMGVKFMANLFNASLSSPIVVFNSALNRAVVYVGDEKADVFALDANTGQVLWSTNLGWGDAVRATPAFASDGTVWVGTNFNPALYKLDGATGQVLCTLKSPNNKPVMGSPMITVPPGGAQQNVYWPAIDNGVTGPFTSTNEQTCAQNFSIQLQSGAWTTASYGTTTSGEGLAMIGTADSFSGEYAIDVKTGAVLWAVPLDRVNKPGFDVGDASVYVPPGTDGFTDGAVLVNNEDGDMFALDLNTGATIWVYNLYNHISAAGRIYQISSVAYNGKQIAWGYYNGIASMNAANGQFLWNWTAPGGVDSSPALTGPMGNQVLSFGDLSGQVSVISMTNGNPLYTFQTNGYIVGSPAVYGGTMYIPSTDGFLYAFAPGGGNGTKPSGAITSPSNGSTVANPNGSLTITGTATDAKAVSNVEISVQAGGESGQWWNGTTQAWQNGPYRNEATITGSGASVSWSYALPVPPNGGAYELFANAVNSNHLVDRGAVSYFSVSPSNNEPTIHTSAFDVAPGATFSASGNAFRPGETVTFTLLGQSVATATVGTTGNVPKTSVTVPSSAPFGPTSLTITGNTSGKSASATVFVSNQWSQYGYGALRTAQEPNDTVIFHTIMAGGSVLNVGWTYQTGAPINTEPAVSHGIAYLGNDGGIESAVNVATGSPMWSYTIPSQAAIQSSAAIDTLGQVIFGANDGNLYVLNSTGSAVKSMSLGGNLGSPAYSNSNIVIGSSNGNVYSIADPAFTINWTASAGGPVTSVAYDAQNGIVVASTSSGKVVAFSSATGATKWTATAGPSVSNVALSPPSIYAGSSDGNVYYLNEMTGAQMLKVNGDGTAVTTVNVNGKGPAFGTADGLMLDANASGAVYYSRSYQGTAIEGLAGAATDEIGTSADGALGLLRPNDGGWHYGTGSAFGAPPVILDGVLYAAAHDGNLYAFIPNGYTPPPNQAFRMGSALITIGGSACTTP